METVTVDELGPFDSVLDVGGSVGDVAEHFRGLWPDATLTSFEPLPAVHAAHARRARGRWCVERLAVSSREGRATLHQCTNQHSASTMQRPGSARALRFRIVDTFADVDVRTVTLDSYAERNPAAVGERLLVKIDVEGHELHVIEGARNVLEHAEAVIVECQQDAEIFLGAPSPDVVDAELRRHRLWFSGVLGVQLAPDGEPVQFDGVWRR